MKKFLPILAVAVAVLLPAHASAGTDHPDCEGRVEISVEAPSFTVPAEYVGWTVWTKAGNNNHRNQGVVTFVTSQEFNEQGNERDISHVDLCPPVVVTTTTTRPEVTTTTVSPTTTTLVVTTTTMEESPSTTTTPSITGVPVTTVVLPGTTAPLSTSTTLVETTTTVEGTTNTSSTSTIPGVVVTTITSPSVAVGTAPVPTSPTPEIPATGVESSTLIWAGALLVVGGILLWVVRRR